MKTILSTILSAAFAGAAFAQVPNLINYQGRLTDANGAAVTGTKNFSISIYDAATAGNLLYTETIGAVNLDDNGVYSFQFGAGGNSSKQVTETVTATNGSATTFQKVLANSPVVAGTVSVSDGTYTWSQSAGSSNEDDFGVAYSTNRRRVTVIYYDGAPAAGRTITASYRYTDGSISGALASGSEHWMAISVDGLTQGTRQRVLAVPFALNSQTAEIANSIPDGTVTAAKLADGALRDASAREGNILMTAQKRPDLEAEGFVLAGSLDLTTSQEGRVLPGLGRGGYTAVWTGTEMIVLEKSELMGSRYNPVTDAWATISSTGAPGFSDSQTAVWSGTEMIVCGRSYNEVTGSYEISGGRYNPVTNTWATISSTGAPQFSYIHTAVWTGTEMIAFGRVYSEITNSEEFGGGRYNPVTDTWTTISSTNSPRFYQDSSYSDGSYAAVWTGTETFFFASSEYINYAQGYTNIIGIRYNPATDTWATISSTGSPKVSGAMGACWTGSEIIVAGSDTSYAGYGVEGARYNPLTDTWTDLTTRNTPEFLGSAVPVWTGTEMIVIGRDRQKEDGSGSTGDYLIGASYDPMSDTWNAISNPNFNQLWQGVGASSTSFWTGSSILLFNIEEVYSYTTYPASIVIVTPRRTFMYVKP
jgi:hypothetical protein